MKWNNKGHQFDGVGNIYKKRNSAYIYGSGSCGLEYFDYISKFNIVDGFIDADEKKWGNTLCGKTVYSPSVIFDYYDEKHIILVAIGDEKIRNMVFDRLERAGYIRNVEFFYAWDFILNLNSIYFPIYMYYAKNKIVISSGCTIPSNFCNLKCKHCLNFTPYIKNFHIRNCDEVFHDMDILFQNVDYFGRFQISGGEPFLYKDFVSVVSYIGKNYRDKIHEFETVTNGTVVPGREICETIVKYNMTVYLDNYIDALPNELNKREEIIKTFEFYGIKWVDNAVNEWFDLAIFDTDNSKWSEQKIMEYFDFCNNPWHYYKNGKMFLCNFAQFAVDAGIHKEDDNSYFDLKSMSDARKVELLEFSLNYSSKGCVELCKRCSGWEHINNKRVPVAIQDK